MLVGAIGIAGGIAARAILVIAKLATAVPLQLLVCTSAGVICATGAWLIGFAR